MPSLIGHGSVWCGVGRAILSVKRRLRANYFVIVTWTLVEIFIVISSKRC